MAQLLNSISEIITTIAALWGAGLSSYLAYKNLISDKPKMFVTCGWSYPVIGGIMDSSPNVLNLEATNAGRREVIVHVLSLEVEGQFYISPSFLENELVKFPRSENNKNADQNKRLKPGEKINASFDVSQLMQFLKRFPGSRIRAYCEDTLENRFLGTWIDIDYKIK